MKSNIEIEDWDLQGDILTIEYTLNDVWNSRIFSVRDLEEFAEKNNLMDWTSMVVRNGEHADDLEGTVEFSTWCKEKLSSQEILLFLESVLHTQ